MQLLVSTLPKNPWWGTGTPVYENNSAMTLGFIPHQPTVEKQHREYHETLIKHAKLHVIDFPEHLDSHKLNRHDFIFTRDSLISNQKGSVVISRFKERARQPEADHMKQYMKGQGFIIHSLSENAYAEGGEFYYSPKDDILFAGLCRNNKKGVEEVAKLLKIKTVCFIFSNHFHLDTVFSTIINKKGHLAGVLACLELINNKNELIAFMKKLKLPLIDINPHDAIGFNGKGKIAVNCLPLSGKLIGGELFTTSGVEEKITALDVKHIISPVSQFSVSGGGIHCLTNELYYEN